MEGGGRGVDGEKAEQRPVWMSGWPAPSPQSPRSRAGSSPGGRAGWRGSLTSAPAALGSRSPASAQDPGAPFLLSIGDDAVMRPVLQSETSRHLRSLHVQGELGVNAGDPSIADLVDEIERRASRQRPDDTDTVMMETSPDVSPSLQPALSLGLTPALDLRGAAELDSFSRLLTFGSATNGAATSLQQPREPTPTVSAARRPVTQEVPSASLGQNPIPYDDDPYLARMRANVAALGEVTAKLRASVSMDASLDPHSRSIMLDSEFGPDRGNATRSNTVQSHAALYRSVAQCAFAQNQSRARLRLPLLLSPQLCLARRVLSSEECVASAGRATTRRTATARRSTPTRMCAA